MDVANNQKPLFLGLTSAQIANGVTALGFVAILGIMLGKVPPTMLSFLLVINITISLVILLVSLYVSEPLEFSTFPTVLLIITFFRLSLNIASTKLILAPSAGAGLTKAGPIIEFFGNIVAGSSPVIGFVIFVILVLIQFIVITKGATRVAEVAARFTLDAMPGKQMAIDADLNAGLISESEARNRRSSIAKEADFYGAMDGASKFVRGDAIASIIITVINIIGGFVVGMLMDRLGAVEVLYKYTILTIGDGLVSQIPSIMVSIAAGVVVTRASGEAALGGTLARQFFGRSEALFFASAALLSIAILAAFIAPNVIIHFGLVGIGLGVTAYMIQRSATTAEEEAVRRREEEEQVESAQPEQVERLLDVDPMEIEIGYGLIPCVDTSQGGDLLDRVAVIRRQTAMEMGLIVPPIRIRDNMQLQPRNYQILIRGTKIAEGELRPDRVLAMHPEGEPSPEEDVPGIKTTEPAFGLPAKWIESSERSRAEMAGYTIVEPSAVLATHLTEIIKNYADMLLGRQEVRELINHLRERNETLVSELTDQVGVKVGTIQKVLQNLVRERVSVRNLEPIFEAIADNAEAVQQNPDALTEYCRMALARSITQSYLDAEGTLPVMTLDPRVEARILDAIQRTGGVGLLASDPAYAEQLMNQVQRQCEGLISQGQQPLLLTTPQLRAHIRRMLERRVPSIIVLSYNEVAPDVQVRRSSTIQVDEAA